MKKSFRHYAVNLIWIAVFAGLALFFTLKGEFKEIMNLLSHIHLFWLLVIFAISLVPAITEGHIFKLFVNIYDKRYTFKQGVVNALSGSFFSGITPFASGGQLAQVYIFKKQGIPATMSVGVLLMYFIIYQVSMVLYTLVVLLCKFQYFFNEYSQFVSLALIGFIINAAVISALFFGAVSARFQHFLTEFVLKIGAKLHLVKDYDQSVKALKGKLRDFRRELNIMRHHKKAITKSLILMFFRLTLQYSLPFLSMLALGVKLPFKEYFNYVGICALIYLITAYIPIPGASGGSEGTYVLLYSYLMGSVLASSTMLIWRFSTYYLVMIIGVIVFLTDKEINSHKEEEET